MLAADNVFAGSIPEIYDRLLVPLIFAPYARDVALRVARAKPRHVLEIAAGTGAVTRELARELPAETRIVATDLNPPMLEHAKARTTGRAIDWRVADALALPFESASFDVVVAQFVAMFFPDKTRAYAETRRVLCPHGIFVFNVWDRLSENEHTAVVVEALAEMFADDPPRFMDRTPHGYFDVERIRGELREAGFSEIAIERLELRSRASCARDVAIGLCQGTPLRNEIEQRDASRLEEATQYSTEALARRFGEGPSEAKLSAFVVTAVSTP